MFFINSNPYAILYTKLITDSEYKDLGIKEIVLYTLMLNRAKLSKNNASYFCDSKGTFIYYSISEISKHLRCNRNTAVKVADNLVKKGFIEKQRQIDGKPAKYYVKFIFEKPDYNESMQRNRLTFGNKKNNKRRIF